MELEAWETGLCGVEISKGHNGMVSGVPKQQSVML